MYAVQKRTDYLSRGIAAVGYLLCQSRENQIGEAGRRWERADLALDQTCDLMGYRALLSGDKYSASAVVLEEAGICFIPKELFMAVLQKDGVLSMEIMKLLSDDLRKAEVSITHFAQKPVRERLAEALLFIKETYGFEADGKTIDLKISREDLANLVGTATETAIRLLSDLKNEGVVALVGKKIEILNLPKLVRIANIED